MSFRPRQPMRQVPMCPPVVQGDGRRSGLRGRAVPRHRRIPGRAAAQIGAARATRSTTCGTDIDTMYGQILRRMGGSPGVRYAVVVPTLFVSRTLDVGPEVRAKLG